MISLLIINNKTFYTDQNGSFDFGFPEGEHTFIINNTDTTQITFVPHQEQIFDIYINNELMSKRAIIISTYALCGFANFSSIGIQIGGISAIAPSRRSDLAKVGLRAMFGGAIASWLTATIAGIFI